MRYLLPRLHLLDLHSRVIVRVENGRRPVVDV